MLIGIVAGELSGDILGSALIQALRQFFPNCEIIGVAGPQMQAAGCKTLFPMERLSVMGATEVLRRLPDLLRARREVIDYFLERRPDVFIGIDAPDFNLGVEEKLHETGIRTVHFVSPSVWAWREKRIYKIKRAVDLMLTLFPFETAIYEKHNIPVKFVGHPLADRYNMVIDKNAARDSLGISKQEKVLTLLPGSRSQEIKQLAEIFIHVAQNCKKLIPELRVIIPAANAQRFQEITKIIQKTRVNPNLLITVLHGEADKALIAADAALAVSGTVTLEAMLLECPMAVAYRFSLLSWLIAKKLVKVPFVSLPNLLANRVLVPEYLQFEANEFQLTTAIVKLLTETDYVNAMRAEFVKLKKQLQNNAAQSAAEAIAELLNKSGFVGLDQDMTTSFEKGDVA